jgi:predicted dehydrogenase
MAKPLRVGVLGANAVHSWAAVTHLPALSALTGSEPVELHAVATTRMDTAAQSAAQWGAELAFDNAKELIEHPDVDAVTVSVQLPHRGELVENVIAAGKHVYCEWPLAIDATAAARLRHLADKAGVQHAIGLQGRHHGAIRYLRDLLAGDEIGEVLSATLTYSAPRSHLSGNVIPQRMIWLADRWRAVNDLTIVGGHAIDMFRSAVGDFGELSALLATRTPSLVVAETGEEIAMTSPDHVLIQGELRSGAVASVQIMMGTSAGTGIRIEVFGRTGRLSIQSARTSLVGSELMLALVRGDEEPSVLPVPDSYRAILPDSPPAVANVGHVYAGLAGAVSTGVPAIPNFDTATELHQLIDSIVIAAETGQRVKHAS